MGKIEDDIVEARFTLLEQRLDELSYKVDILFNCDGKISLSSVCPFCVIGSGGLIARCLHEASMNTQSSIDNLMQIRSQIANDS